MKLNLQCGPDIIVGYRNIDINPTAAGVEKGDFRNLTNVINESVDEIRAINVVQLIHMAELTKVLNHWFSKLKKGGEIYIQAIDMNLVGNSTSYGQISIEDANKLIFGIPGNLLHLGIYDLNVIETNLNNGGIATVEKGYNGQSFWIRGTKNG